MDFCNYLSTPLTNDHFWVHRVVCHQNFTLDTLFFLFSYAVQQWSSKHWLGNRFAGWTPWHPDQWPGIHLNFKSAYFAFSNAPAIFKGFSVCLFAIYKLWKWRLYTFTAMRSEWCLTFIPPPRRLVSKTPFFQHTITLPQHCVQLKIFICHECTFKILRGVQTPLTRT